MKKPFIGIVGGTGKTGLQFARFFKRKGYRVAISHYDKNKAERVAKKNNLVGKNDYEIIKDCNVVFFSLPLEKTEKIIKELAPLARPGMLLSDFTSLKVRPLKVMLKTSKSGVNVIGLHPLFGPSVRKFEGQTIAVVPGRGKKYLKWLKNLFSDEGMKVKVCTAEEHDKMMAVVQCLTHFSSIVTADALRRLSIDVKESLKFASPLYRIKMDISGRILSQDPALYSSIQILNSYSKKVIKEFIKSSKELDNKIRKKDRNGFISYFRKASKFLGSLKKQATKESDYLIEKLAVIGD